MSLPSSAPPLLWAAAHGYKLLFCTALGAPSQHLLHQPRRGSAPLPTPFFSAWYLESIYFFQLIIWHLKKYVLKGSVRERQSSWNKQLPPEAKWNDSEYNKVFRTQRTVDFLEFGVFYSWHLDFARCIELHSAFRSSTFYFFFRLVLGLAPRNNSANGVILGSSVKRWLVLLSLHSSGVFASKLDPCGCWAVVIWAAHTPVHSPRGPDNSLLCKQGLPTAARQKLLLCSSCACF